MNIAGILLAAGSGSRFGGGKLLHPLPDGVAIGVASARNLLRALPRVVAVVRPDDAGLGDLLRAEGAEVVVCADAHLGMGASLACGVRAAADADGWVIALADMPYIAPGTIAAVAQRVERGAAIAAPVYRGERGHPVAFGARLRSALLESSGDEGARALLVRHRREIERVECDDAGVLRDIDTRADLDGTGVKR